MLNSSVNTMFNNALFSCRNISAMHEQMTRLYEAAEKMAGTTGQAGLARLLNVSSQTVNNWETRGISADGLLKIQELIGCNANWIKSGIGDMRIASPSLLALMLDDEKLEQAEAETRDRIEIKQYQGAGGAMGNGVILRDQPGEIKSWRVTPEWISKNVKSHSGVTNLCIVTGFGDSMQPMYNPGDPLLVDVGVRSVDFDAVYFFRVGNEGFIKRLQRIPGEGIRVISKNKDYEAWTIKPDMDFEVFGRVLKVWCSTDF